MNRFSGNGYYIHTGRHSFRKREVHRLLHVELFTVAGAKRQLRLAREREQKETGT